MKLVEREIEDAEAVHHRIGVGQRAEQQHRDRVDDQEGEEHQQAGRPQPAERETPGCFTRCDPCGGFRGHAAPLKMAAVWQAGGSWLALA